MTDSANEQWAPANGYEGVYEVSTYGRVRSLDRLIVSVTGQKYMLPGVMLKLQLDKRGYYWVSFSLHSRIKRKYVHQLVLDTFVRPKRPGEEGRHLNGCPTDNRLNNLAWGTKAENIADAKAHGTFPVLERRPGAKLTRAQVRAIFTSNESSSVLARQNGVGIGVVRQIKLRETWAAVTEGLTPGRYKRRGTWFGLIGDEALFDNTRPRVETAKLLGVTVIQLKNMRRTRRKQIAAGK